MNLSEPFIRRPVATSLWRQRLIAGLVAFTKLPVAPLPRVDFPTLQVNVKPSGRVRNDGIVGGRASGTALWSDCGLSEITSASSFDRHR